MIFVGIFEHYPSSGGGRLQLSPYINLKAVCFLRKAGEQNYKLFFSCVVAQCVDCLLSPTPFC